MSKFEQLRTELERIKQEAVQREAIKLGQQRTDEHEKIERARLIESNWSLSQGEIIKVLHELNRTVLDSKGKIENWKQVSYSHVHGHEIQYDGGSSINYCRYQGEMVRAGLKIPEIGGIFFIKSLHCQVSRSYEDGTPVSLLFFPQKYSSYSEYYADKIYVAIYVARIHKGPRQTWGYENPCPECTGTSFPLDLQPEEIKDKIEKEATTSLKALFSKFYSH